MMKHVSTWVVSTLIATALATPALSQTKEADVKYCKALVEAYREWLAGPGHAQVKLGNVPRSLEVTNALEGCKSGDTASAISTLEKHLRDHKVALPPR